ncbi:PREDICTED: RPA-interacting protein B [Vollenhovia emeryi]|uniref:RPA-interacting protein B n=1 Tax=Vollenhovia emeryi TaxID=411798 RepID=UPI0005F429F0|nr:PREDICTED: RPA-interacting protein B [Vollenhovia emeryi]
MTSKLRNRDCANKIRHGAPKLQEVLRERCRQRMRDKRSQLFDRHRFGVESHSKPVQDSLTEIIRQEFKNLATEENNGASLTFKEIDEPLTQDEAIELENEIVFEEEQWIFQEYEKILQDEIEYFAMYADNENKEVFCPICQKAILAEENNCVNCPVCGLKLTGRTMQEVRHLINQSVNTHAFNCVQVPVFMVIPENCKINLYLICHGCSTLALIC